MYKDNATQSLYLKPDLLIHVHIVLLLMDCNKNKPGLWFSGFHFTGYPFILL